jgi:hypothetical protein
MKLCDRALAGRELRARGCNVANLPDRSSKFATNPSGRGPTNCNTCGQGARTTTQPGWLCYRADFQIWRNGPSAP